jgi:hypothetical protein
MNTVESDPRLEQIQQQRQRIQNQMARAQMVINSIGILEQSEAELRRLGEEEAKIKGESQAKPEKAKK